nr:ATP-binding protein [uncultured Marvinbryantia sp.]
MQIIKGKIPSAKKITIYGPEGIGKSTFAAQFPDPVFIDTEGSTKEMDVARFKKPTSWTMLLEQINYVKNNPDICRTLVIDTIDWAEAMCVEHICAKHHKDGLESFGYGMGYVYVKEEFGRFLNSLEEVVNAGVNVVLTAHAQIRKFEQPDEMGAYDRWELKLGKKTSSQTAPLVKEWSDALLFANYKTYSVAADDKGKKHKAQGGTRVMYTNHHPCWDAKNRYGLPDEVPFEYASIAHILENTAPVRETSRTENATTRQEYGASNVQEQHDQKKDETETERKVPDIPADGEQMTLPGCGTGGDDFPEPDPQIPKALRDLMKMHGVLEWDIQNVVAARGYFPSDMPVKDYPADFISGVLVGAWPQVHAMIKDMKEKEEIPFD